MNLPDEIERVQVAHLMPGDMVIFSVRGFVSDEDKRRILDSLGPSLPPGVKAFVVDDSVSVAVYRPVH